LFVGHGVDEDGDHTVYSSPNKGGSERSLFQIIVGGEVQHYFQFLNIDTNTYLFIGHATDN
jgi:hypothetical protein